MKYGFIPIFWTNFLEYVNIKFMKRLAIYVYHNEMGVIEDYALFYLKSLLEVADEIIVVINGAIEKNELLKLNNPFIKIIQRENKGYDFWAYRAGFFSIGSEKLKTFDEIIFANSSVYGPIYPFFELFEKMREKRVDFWGITKHQKTKKIKEHIQSYFFVVRKNLFLNPIFRLYFENLRKIKNKKEAIKHLEINFTEYFQNKGFKWGVFVDDDILNYGVENYHQYLSFLAVEKFKCPVIKKTIFAKRYDLALKEGQTDETYKLFEFIKNNTNYDINLILPDILKIYSMDEIKEYLHLNFILSNELRENFYSPKIAAFFDLSDETINGAILPYIKNMQGAIDIKGFNLSNKNEILKDAKIQITDIQNFKKESLNYDYIFVFAPDKKVLSKFSNIEKINYTRHILNCTFNNRIFLSNLINVFIKNKNIATLTPIPYTYKGFEIAPCIFNIKELKTFLNLIKFIAPYNVQFLNTILPAIWLKKELIEKIPDNFNLNKETTLNIGVIFSLFAQKFGFLSGSLSDVLSSKIYIDNLQYKVLNQNKFLSKLAYKVYKAFKKKWKTL